MEVNRAIQLITDRRESNRKLQESEQARHSDTTEMERLNKSPHNDDSWWVVSRLCGAIIIICFALEAITHKCRF